MTNEHPSTWPIEKTGNLYRRVNHGLKQAVGGWYELEGCQNQINFAGTESMKRNYRDIYGNGQRGVSVPKDPVSNPPAQTFNLTAVEAGKPIVTRDGRKAEFVGRVKSVIDGSVVFAVDGIIVVVNSNGCISKFAESPLDLFMDKEEIEIHFNRYTDGSFGNIYLSAEKAIAVAVTPTSATLHSVKIKV